MGGHGIIHGDLSPYNILNFEGKPYIIDFSQSLKLTSLTKDYLERDVTNINNWFEKLGKTDPVSYKNILESIENYEK